ncbi:hypothetical protein SprV_0100002900 [Sparganum proliferum]
MEAIVKKATMEFLEQGHLLSDLQHGFRQNRSCLSSLLLSTEKWTRALDEDGRVDVIYTDFKKAFDSVPHKRLIYKLSEIGIRGRLLTWITDFLTGRSQTVCIEASTSTPTPVLIGVPQGSVLGPLLFLVYINDCVDDLGCSAILFADDVKLWRPIRSDADRYALQDSLNRLNSWSARWLLNFNVDKCVVLRLRTRRTSKEDDSFQYVLGGQSLSNVVEQKDLGVLMTSSLKPSSQCQRAAKSAIRVLFALRRGFVQIDKKLFGKTYGTFVRSHLEYAVQAWRPWLKKDYQRLERVQAMATKMVKNLHHLPYESRLTELNRFPLNYTQLRGDLIQTYRIVRSREFALDFDDFFELAGTDRMRGHPFKLQRKRAHSDVRRNAFSQRDQPQSERRDAGVSYAIQSDREKQLPCLPQGINDGLMTVRLPLRECKFATIIGAYVTDPMASSDRSKKQILRRPPCTSIVLAESVKLVVLGQFSARVSAEYPAWNGVLIFHGFDVCHINGLIVLQTYSEQGLLLIRIFL